MLWPLDPEKRAAERATRAAKHMALLSSDGLLALEPRRAVVEFGAGYAEHTGGSVAVHRVDPLTRKRLLVEPIEQVTRRQMAEARAVIEAEQYVPAGGLARLVVSASRRDIEREVGMALRGEPLNAALLLLTLFKLDKASEPPTATLAARLLLRPGGTARVLEQDLTKHRQLAPLWAAAVAAIEHALWRPIRFDEFRNRLSDLLRDPVGRGRIFRWEPAFRRFAIDYRKPRRPEYERILRTEEAIVYRTGLNAEPPALIELAPDALKAASRALRIERAEAASEDARRKRNSK
ncbi:hypothetical protein JMJ56_23145 [Belnapia sp. T18]|uniref:Uncharacterized protein n=1 Tax=Belnapia arida TaxID=2804533 RepID=A0ABS1U8C4_9PROT|nr:hypothetical protein [Belnapia arida]MBL6080914.1 hypothetical protein [Belnapia arida]